MSARHVIAALVLAVLAGACSAADAEGPPEINYGRDICVQCNMIISEAGHAAAYRLDDGAEKLFDGVGEMVLHGRTNDEFARAEAWVHDFWSEEWVEADAAFYVPTLALASPMGHGIFAFATEERAAEFAADVDGEVIDWATVLRLPTFGNLVGEIHGPMGAAAEADADHGSTMDDMEESEE